MITATRILPAGSWSGIPADSLILERDDRHRRRLVMRCENKTVFLLNLPEAKVMKEGDALELEDGRLILVKARPERLLEITAADPAHLVRIAWHLGNRHLPTQLMDGRLRIREDHVIEDMLVKLGATVAHVEGAFDPEGGAYGHGAVQGHDHAHDHAHQHDHDHHHDPAHDHEHGDGCGCGHDHHDHGHHHDHHHHDHGHHAPAPEAVRDILKVAAAPAAAHHDHAHGPDCGCGYDHAHDHAGHAHPQAHDHGKPHG